MIAVKLAVELLRGLGWFACIGCLFFAGGILLQGVAQLAVEGLANRSETAEETRARLNIVYGLFSAAFGGSVVFQAAGVISRWWKGACRPRVRRAVFQGLVFWAGVCIFFCLLILVGSFQARWEVDRRYYWLAAGAGVIVPVLLGAAEFFWRGETIQPARIEK